MYCRTLSLLCKRIKISPLASKQYKNINVLKSLYSQTQDELQDDIDVDETLLHLSTIILNISIFKYRDNSSN